MGTRADFYVGKGNGAEWIGSIAYDGYRDGVDQDVLSATSDAAYRSAVAAFLNGCDHATVPEQGWPWPWDNSDTTDCSYWFFDGQVWDAAGYPCAFYAPCSKDAPNEDEDGWSEGLEPIEYPDMSARKNVTLGERSGLLIISGR